MTKNEVDKETKVNSLQLEYPQGIGNRSSYRVSSNRESNTWVGSSWGRPNRSSYREIRVIDSSL